VLSLDDGDTAMGLLSQLGPGTVLEPCGHGFNDRTAKVRANGFYYFVFEQDIELARRTAPVSH
jgi:hypothetical protein